jgi:RNA polymerase sigma-70 factor (ECF subfamily)
MPPPPPAEPPSEPASTQEKDLEWIRRIQNGDAEALRELIETHQNRVAAVALRIGGPGTDVDNVAHETFIRVWKSAHRYQPTARFTSWLLTITRNILLNEIRYQNRHPTVPLDPLEERDGPLTEGPADPHARQPDESLLEVELQDAIDAALQQLPETQRTALILRTYEDLAYEEIALVLETSVASVKSLIFRARSAMKELLREYLS